MTWGPFKLTFFDTLSASPRPVTPILVPPSLVPPNSVPPSLTPPSLVMPSLVTPSFGDAQFGATQFGDAQFGTAHVVPPARRPSLHSVGRSLEASPERHVTSRRVVLCPQHADARRPRQRRRCAHARGGMRHRRRPSAAARFWCRMLSQ